LKSNQKWWRYPIKSECIISTARHVSPLKDAKSTLKLARVEMVEIFSMYLVKNAVEVLGDELH
jgi:hypothetical protein